jgi:hypothetical protein
MNKIGKKGLATVIGLLCLTGCVQAQAVAAFADDTIALGDQTTLSIRRAHSYPGTEVLSQNGIVALSQEFDSATHTQTTLITSFEPGDHYLHLGDDSLLLVVTDVDVDTSSAEIRDIAPIERVPYTFWELFRWVLLIWAVAIVAIVAYWLIDRKRRHGSIIVHHEPVDTRTPEERALQTLEELRRSQLWQSGKSKEYHTALTDAVRCFIEEATGIRATDMTSDETVEAVEGLPQKVDTTILRSIFSTADIVKFAKGEPLPHEHEASLQNAVGFVKALWTTVHTENGEEADHE